MLVKKTIWILLAILLIVIPFATPQGSLDGVTITQEQLDAFNPDNINANFLECNSNGQVYLQGNKLTVDYACLYIYPQSDGQYFIRMRDYKAKVKLSSFIECLETNNFGTCADNFWTEIINQALKEIAKTKKRVIDLQTHDGQGADDLVNDIFG